MASTTKQRLIDAAYELFSREGFHGVGLDRIIDDVGVSKQTFYNHFESKDGLMLAVLEHRSKLELEDTRRMLRQLGGIDPADRLRALWDALDVWFQSPDFRGCIFITAAAEFPAAHDPAHKAAAAHARAMQELILELAVLAGAEDPEQLAEHLMLLLDGAIVVRHVMGNDRATAIARRGAELVMARHLPAKRKRAVSAAAAAIS